MPRPSLATQYPAAKVAEFAGYDGDDAARWGRRKLRAWGIARQDKPGGHTYVVLADLLESQPEIAAEAMRHHSEAASTGLKRP